MKLLCTRATTPAVGPTLTSFVRLNSSPRKNISRMTPSSERDWTVPASAITGRGMYGPTIIPATR